MRNHTKSKKLQPHCSTQILPPATACIIIYPEEPNFQRPRPLYQACTREPKRRSPRRPTKLFWSFSRKPAIGLHWSSFSVTPTRRCIATSLVSPAPPSRMTYCKKLRCRFFASSLTCASPPSSAPGPSASLPGLLSLTSSTLAAGSHSTTHPPNNSPFSTPLSASRLMRPFSHS